MNLNGLSAVESVHAIEEEEVDEVGAVSLDVMPLACIARLTVLVLTCAHPPHLYSLCYQCCYIHAHMHAHTPSLLPVLLLLRHPLAHAHTRTGHILRVHEAAAALMITCTHAAAMRPCQRAEWRSCLCRWGDCRWLRYQSRTPLPSLRQTGLRLWRQQQVSEGGGSG